MAGKKRKIKGQPGERQGQAAKKRREIPGEVSFPQGIIGEVTYDATLDADMDTAQAAAEAAAAAAVAAEAETQAALAVVAAEAAEEATAAAGIPDSSRDPY